MHIFSQRDQDKGTTVEKTKVEADKKTQKIELVESDNEAPPPKRKRSDKISHDPQFEGDSLIPVVQPFGESIYLIWKLPEDTLIKFSIIAETHVILIEAETLPPSSEILKPVNEKLAIALGTAKLPKIHKMTVMTCPRNWSLLKPQRFNLQEGKVVVLVLDILDFSNEKGVLVL